MKINQYLMTVAAFALLLPAAAQAETVKSQNEVRAEASTTGNISVDAKKAWKDVKHDAQVVADEAERLSKKMEARMVDETYDVKATPKTVSYIGASSAANLIGSHVYNEKNVRIGTIKDIIVNSGGNTEAIIVADGEFPGFDGKLVALKATSVTRQDADGDVIIPLTEKAIDEAAEFNYAPGTGNAKTYKVPQGGYSISKLLDGQVLDAKGNKLGEIDDIAFKGGKADLVIVGFDKVLGVGGEQTAIAYAPAKIKLSGDEADLQLSAKHSASLASYMKLASK